jgi:uncharacterized protein YkwD
MSRCVSVFTGIFALVAFVIFSSTSAARAETQKQPVLADSPYDLINAVNALRASYGIAPYSISSILMYTAQAQADFMAATGNMTHSGPGGIGVTERLLAAGYPLAGDLSLGGFRSENITGGSENMSAQTAVERWTGDAPHLTTMISPNLTEIGAGVAVNNGRVYYVIDCALPTTSGASSAAATSIEGGTTVPAPTRDLAVMIPVMLSTPDGEGNIVHEVKSGQTLWQIAIAYQVKIDEIKGLNNLSDNSIYPGDKLLIRMGMLMPTVTLAGTEAPAQTATVTPTSLPASTVTASAISITTPTIQVSPVPVDNSIVMKVAMGVIALALVGGGFLAWLGGGTKKK